MRILWPYMLLLPPALILAWEDFRTREVSVGWLWMLGLLVPAVGWKTGGLSEVARYAAANLSLLLCLGAILVLYHLLLRRPLGAFFTRSFGAGDAAMLVALVPLFRPTNYVRFVLVSCLAALAWWLVRRPKTIPLAGFMALTLAVYALCKTAGLWS